MFNSAMYGASQQQPQVYVQPIYVPVQMMASAQGTGAMNVSFGAQFAPPNMSQFAQMPQMPSFPTMPSLPSAPWGAVSASLPAAPAPAAVASSATSASQNAGLFGGGNNLLNVALMAILFKNMSSSDDRIDTIRREHEEEINRIKSEYAENLDRIARDRQTEIAQIRARHDQAIASLQASHTRDLNDLRARQQRELQNLANASEAERNRLIQQHNQQITALQNQQASALATLRAQHQAEITRIINSSVTALAGSVNEGLDSQYFTDADLQRLITNPQRHWTEIRNAHDNKVNLTSPNRYDLNALRNTFPDLRNILPPTKYGSGHTNKNYLLGEAQNALDIVNRLKTFKTENYITSNAQIDGLITRLTERARNFIKSTNNLGSPIAFDLNGDGKINTRAASAGTRFDLNADGSKEGISWVSGDDGLLVLDRNGNGTIDDGKELFGDQHGAANGFEELKKSDSNGDGKIDSADAVFNNLKVWQDANGDGISQASELKTLAQLGIQSIGLSYSTDDRFIDDNGVDHREHGSITTANGTRKAVDVWFELAS